MIKDEDVQIRLCCKTGHIFKKYPFVKKLLGIKIVVTQLKTKIPNS